MESKRVMNDMVITKKPVVKKQVVQTSPHSGKMEERVPPLRKEGVATTSSDGGVNRSGCLLWVIAIMCVVGLGVGIGGLFTRATITIIPKKFIGSIDTTITLSQNREKDTVFFGTATKTFTTERVVTATDYATEDVKASGTVRLYNKNTIAKTVSANTEIVSSAGKKYIISKTITIPAQIKTTPGQIDVNVVAITAGGDGNSELDDFTFSKPNKLLQGITMRSVTPMRGGVMKGDPVPATVLIEQTKEQLKQEMGTTPYEQRLAELLPDNLVMLPINVPRGGVVFRQENHEDGVHIIASQEVTILMADIKDIAQIFGKSLKVPKDLQVTFPTDQDASALTMMTNDIIPGQSVPQKVQVRVTGDATVVGFVETDTLKQKLVGLTRKNTKELLVTIPEIESSSISMTPPWRRLLPMSEDDIEVVVR